METFISAPQLEQTPVYKIKRKPAPTLLSPISPITPLRTNIDGMKSSPVVAKKVVSQSDPPSPLPNPNVIQPSTSLFTDPRYPPPDVNDPFAPLSVLRDRNRRSSFHPLLSSSTAGSDDIGSWKTNMASTDNLSISASTKSSFIQTKTAKTLGVLKGLPNANGLGGEKNRSERPRKKTSVYSFELSASGIRVRGDSDRDSEEDYESLGTPKKHTRPSSKSKVSTPNKPGSGSPIGHYTPHSRQRAQSSFSVLSSPSPHSKLHVLTPAPEAHPPPSLVRDRSESSASSTGTGGDIHSGSMSDSSNSTLATPGNSIPPASLRGSGSRSSPIEISDSYALTMALLSSAQAHSYTRSEAHKDSRSGSQDSSPSRSAYVPGKGSPGHTPKAERTKERGGKEVERATSPTSGMRRLARFFTGGKGLSRKNSVGSLMALDGSPSRVEKTKSSSPSSKLTRGRGRTRKLSTSSINISGPVSPPVSIPMRQDLRQHVEGLPKPVNRPRSHTTSGLPPAISTLPAATRPNPYAGISAKFPSASVSASSIGLSATSHVNELGVISDEDVEDEIRKDLDISRLKPWAASIPRKRSSLSLSTLPTPAVIPEREWDVHQTGSGSSLSLSKTEEDGISGKRKSKGSRESAVSAGSMGSSYIHVGSGDGTCEPGPTPAPLRSKTSGSPKSSVTHGITGIRFPGFRRGQAGSQTSQNDTPSNSMRGLKISNPILHAPVPRTAALAPPISTSSISFTPPAPQPIQIIGRAMSDSGIGVLDQSTRSASPSDMDILEDDEDQSVSSTQLPTASELETLLALPLLDENGQKAALGDILDASGSEDKSVIVIFIRHFWCPLDQDYVEEVRDLLHKLAENGGGWQLATEEGELRLGQKNIPEVIIVSNGSFKLIAKYKEIFDLGGEKASGLRVKMFTDPTLRTYDVLKMGKMGEACVNVSPRPTTPIIPSERQTPSPPDSQTRGRSHIPSSDYDAGIPLVRIDHRTPPRKDPKGHRKSRSLVLSSSSLFPPSGTLRTSSRSPSSERLSPDILGLERSVSPTPSTSSTQSNNRRSYIKHASVIGGIATVVLRAVKVGMPVWEKGGAIKQLGGEVVFKVKQDRGQQDPTTSSHLQVSCLFAHRMQNAQDHTPFGDILKIALTTSPSAEFVSFSTTAASGAHVGHSSMRNIRPPYERSFSAPGGVQEGASSAPCTPVTRSHDKAQTDVLDERSSTGGPVWWATPTEEESTLDTNKAYQSISDSESKLDSWGNQLHILRTRVSENGINNASESIRGIRARDSIRSSTSSTADSSIRAMRTVRVPRGPRMRMQNASAEILTSNRSRGVIQSIASEMEGIESVLEFGDSIGSPDLGLLAQLGIGPVSWRGRYAVDSTSTSSVYYDAPEGILESVDAREATEEEGEEEELRFTVDVVPVDSRPVSASPPEGQDRTFDSIQCEYSAASADQTEHLTSICSESEDECEDDTEKLKDLLVMRASSGIRRRGI